MMVVRMMSLVDTFENHALMSHTLHKLSAGKCKMQKYSYLICMAVLTDTDGR
jgi:hypothetical protein